MRVVSLLAAALVLALSSCGGSDEGLLDPGGTAGLGGAGGTTSEAGLGGGAGLAGEGGAAGEDGGTGPDAEQACVAFATQYCGRLDACAPTLVKIYYKDAQDCIERLAGPCVKALAIPDTSKSPEWTAACASAMEATSCEDLLVRRIPAACVPAGGPRAVGAVCGEDGQCDTSYCQYHYNVGCGTCRARAGEGQDCASDDDCALGLGCAKSLKCAAFGEVDEPCDSTLPCRPGLSCVGASASVKGSCRMPAGPGAPCDAAEQTLPNCDLLHGYFCNIISHLCQELTFAEGGDPCGVVGSGYAICTASSVCKLTSQYSGNCMAAAADGEACNVTNGPACKPLAQCLNGVCMDPEPKLCN